MCLRSIFRVQEPHDHEKQALNLAGLLKEAQEVVVFQFLRRFK